MDYFQELLSEENIESSLSYLKDKKDTCGIDELRVSQLDDYLSNNKELFINLLKTNKYKSKEVELVDIVSKTGKIRSIAKICSLDKLVSRMISNVIDPILSSLFKENSFAYQKDKGTIPASLEMKKYLEEGYTYILDLDINKYFDNINHNILSSILKRYIDDNEFINLIFKFVKVNIIHNYKKYTLNKGVLQGSLLSPLLSNIFLNDVDAYFLSYNIKYIRYADDIRIFSKSIEEISKYKNIIVNKLEEYDLKINEKKTRIININKEIPRFLGYEFLKVEGTNNFEIKKIIRNGNFNHYSLWNPSPICKVNDEYHIVSDGILTQEDYNLLFENESKKENIVLDNVESMNIYSNVIFSKKMLETMYYKKITLSFYNKYQEFIGVFIPYSINTTTTFSIDQLQHYIDMDKRMYIAKQFVISAGHNLRENLKYYLKQLNNDSINSCIDKITNLLNKEKECKEYNNLLSLEGNVRIIYYSCINEIINSNTFNFKNRNKRPPLDPINALISYGNTILYRYVAKKIYKSKLDIRIGFLHATNNRLESLNLDIAEIFRPIIVDKVIFSLINKHEIKEDCHFEYREEDNGCYLNSNGRRIFINAFENKMYSKIKIKDKYYSYSDLITNEINKLTNHFKNIKPYKAYKYFM